MELREEQHSNLPEKLILELEKLIKAIRVLSRGYLPTEIFPFDEMKKITDTVRDMVKQSHPGYDLAVPHLTHYYYMKLVIFAADNQGNMIVSFPIFVKQHSVEPMTLMKLKLLMFPS